MTPSDTPATAKADRCTAKADRSAAKAPPAWLLFASMFAFAVVTIVLVVTGQ